MSRIVLLAALALACAAVLPISAGATTPKAHSAAKACWSGYSYNGVQSPTRAFGVSATLTMNARSTVGEGHVAAWIGVGGAGMGPGGSDEWVQAGVAHDAGGVDQLYYEFRRPGDASATYVTLGRTFAGDTHTIVVYERAGYRDSWRVMIDRA